MFPAPEPQPTSLPYPLPPAHPRVDSYGPPIDAPHMPPTQSFAPDARGHHDSGWNHEQPMPGAWPSGAWSSAAWASGPWPPRTVPPQAWSAGPPAPGEWSAAGWHQGSWQPGPWQPRAWPTQPASGPQHSPRKKTTAGLLQIVGGWAGLGRFYAGDSRRGGIHLAVFSSGIFVPGCTMLSMFMVAYGVIDGIQILILNARDDTGRLLSE